MSDTAPAGWYPDPRDPAVEYWWDGTQYTQSRPIETAAPAIPKPPAATPPAVYTPQPSYAPAAYAPAGYAPLAPGVSPKSRTVAAILGFFLGGIGVHRFYLGNIGLGLGLLLAGWLTLGIWPLIDWIIVLAGQARDGQGLLVVNWQ